MSLSRLFTPRGEIGRGRFLALGCLLVAIKLTLDAFICRVVFDYHWQLRDYLWSHRTLTHWPAHVYPLVTTLLIVAAPFAWMGVCLTTQRLRAVRAPIWLVVLFFVPLLKFVLFAILAVLPTRPQLEPLAPLAPPVPVTGFRRSLPESIFANAFLAAVIGCALGFIFIHWRRTDLAGLFMGVPFFIGFIGGVLHEARAPHRLRESVAVALIALLIVGVAFVALAVDGVVCVLMAAPLAVCEAIAGAFVAHAFSDAMRRRRFRSSISVGALLPVLMLLETDASPPLHSITSEIIVDAPPRAVWPHVIRFAEIPPPNELIFRAGIAFPIRAVIDGRGVGAIRHCVFSTGEFVEPITVWDQPHRLAFNVTAQPDPLQELSPYRDLHPPHLRGYFQSEHGEFQLIPLPGERTLLRGTTWYSDRIEPQAYWCLWSDWLIHRIHLRVLQHIRDETVATR